MTGARASDTFFFRTLLRGGGVGEGAAAEVVDEQVLAAGQREAGLAGLVAQQVGVEHLQAGRFQKRSGTFAGTARKVLRTKVPDPF